MQRNFPWLSILEICGCITACACVNLRHSNLSGSDHYYGDDKHACMNGVVYCHGDRQILTPLLLYSKCPRNRKGSRDKFRPMFKVTVGKRIKRKGTKTLYSLIEMYTFIVLMPTNSETSLLNEQHLDDQNKAELMCGCCHA